MVDQMASHAVASYSREEEWPRSQPGQALCNIPSDAARRDFESAGI